MEKQEWDIKSRADTCTQCERGFADQEEFFTRLSFENGEYVRRDLCSTCWKPESKQGSLSVWHTIFRLPPPPTPEPLQKETAESLLRKLMEADDPAARNTIYILAVMLERKRILIERDVQVHEDGSKVRVYEHRRTNETFMIPDPGLRLAELASVQQEVVAMLGGQGGGEPAPAPAAPPPENAPPV